MDRELIRRQLGERLELSLAELHFRPVSGGDINHCFLLDDGRYRFFMKTNRAELLPMFEAEWLGLDEIRRSASIRVPEAYVCGCSGEQAYLIMEYIPLGARPDPVRLAGQLALMHGHGQEGFGFHCDNSIGSTPQRNPFCDDWVEFWQKHRLGFQLALGARRGFDSALVEAGDKLNRKIGQFFQDYRPESSLLHGDLWSGNQGSDDAGEPVIFDPACYYGDHEADLAMMELFGHPGERFFAAYHEIFPIHEGYRLRRDLYNLYHLLNHANLFGGGYQNQARRMIDLLLSRL